MTPAHPTSQPPTRPTAAPAKPPAAAATSSPATTANADAGKITPSDKDKSDQNNAENNNDKNDVTVRTFPKSTAKASQPAAQTLKLVIRATETSSISVFADGQPVSHETLIAPAHTSVRASREITVHIGNAAGVTFLWNGQEISADGAESEAKTFVFDSNGMRVIPTPLSVLNIPQSAPLRARAPKNVAPDAFVRGADKKRTRSSPVPDGASEAKRAPFRHRSSPVQTSPPGKGF